MNKIKNIWNENKVLLVLGIILIVCIIVVSIVALTYFYGGSDSVYGNRLNEVDKVPLNDKLFEEIKSNLQKNESVQKVSIVTKGKIIYISIAFTEGTSMDNAKDIANSTITLFNDDELNVYDLEFTISSLSTTDIVGYTLMGARNANGSGEIIWNNYNTSVEEEE